MTTTKKLQRHTQTLSGHHSQWCEISGTLNNKTPPLLLVLVVTRIGNEPVPHTEELQNPQWNTGDMSAGITSSDASANPNMLDNTSLYGCMSVEPRMRSEQDRLRTFHAWPSDAPVSSAELAKAGFFFLGPGDKVQCFCCGGILRQWVRGDCPWNEHVRHFPTCSFILSRNVGNIPHVITQGSSDYVDGQLLSQLQRMTVEEVSGGQPVYPEMETEQSRVTTFHTWPPHAPVQPQILARAGFFYTGLSDNVKCFYCDGGLRNWESGDDPWQEHAKWFPRCEFLLQARGRDYINNIQESYFNTGGPGSGSLSSGAGEITSGRDVVGNQDLSPLLQSPAIQTVLQMGFDHSLVESLVQTKYLLTGNRYTSVSDLVSDILQAEEEDRHRSDQARETSESPRQSTSAGEARETQQSEEKAGDRSPEEQLRQLQEERTCKVCMDKVVSIVFIPCGHLVVCSDCAASLSNCPICRAVIRGSVRAFMS